VTQAFKENDAIEARFADTFFPIQNQLSLDRDAFYAGAYTAEPLGDVFRNLNADPLARVLAPDVYRNSFPAIHDLFTRPGTFEYYLAVFRKVFGTNVIVEFTIPSPGVLNINVEAVELQLTNFLAREIVEDVYVTHEVLDEEGDNIVFQALFGIKTQVEMDLLINELAPSIIFTTATLVVS